MGRSPETKDAFALGLYLTQLLVEAVAKRDGLTGKFDVFLACVGRDLSLIHILLSAAVGGILAGPVLAGMYDTVLRALRDEAGYWWTTYRKAFKQNFKASILPGVLYCVVVTVQILSLIHILSPSVLMLGTRTSSP